MQKRVYRMRACIVAPIAIVLSVTTVVLALFASTASERDHVLSSEVLHAHCGQSGLDLRQQSAAAEAEQCLDEPNKFEWTRIGERTDPSGTQREDSARLGMCTGRAAEPF